MKFLSIMIFNDEEGQNFFFLIKKNRARILLLILTVDSVIAFIFIQLKNKNISI